MSQLLKSTCLDSLSWVSEAREARKLDPTLAFSLLRTGEPSGLLEWRKADSHSEAHPQPLADRRSAKQPEQSTHVPITQGFKASSNAPAPENGTSRSCGHSGAWLWGLGQGACPNRLTKLTKPFWKKMPRRSHIFREDTRFQILKFGKTSSHSYLGEPHPGTGSLNLSRSICPQKTADLGAPGWCSS